jgi:hypothetical protein
MVMIQARIKHWNYEEMTVVLLTLEIRLLSYFMKLIIYSTISIQALEIKNLVRI